MEEEGSLEPYETADKDGITQNKDEMKIDSSEYSKNEDEKEDNEIFYDHNVQD